MPHNSCIGAADASDVVGCLLFGTRTQPITTAGKPILKIADNSGGYRHQVRAEIAAGDRHDYGGAVLGTSLRGLKFQAPAECRGPLSHSREPDASRLTPQEMIQSSGRYATAVIAHRQGERFRATVHLDFCASGSRVKMYVR